MSNRLIHAVVGLLLSGCTINQYGPHITVEDAITSTVVDVSVDDKPAAPSNRDRVVIHKPNTPAPAAPVVIEKPVPRSRPGCIPMPEIPEPPKLDIELLARFSNDEKQLQLLFEKNHSDLFKHASHMKKVLEQWYLKPNRC